MATASEITRMSGLVSGLDMESLVKAASMNTKSAINTKKQKLQTLQWKQEGYRKVIDTLTEFQNKYLKIDSATSVRANAVMKANKATSSNDKLSVSATANAVAGEYKITAVKKATAAKISGTAASEGTVTLDFSKAAAGKNTVEVTLDSTTRTIEFEGGANAKENFLKSLNDTFKGVSNARFSFKDGTNKLTIVNASDDKVSHKFTVGYSDSVGLASEASNSVSTTSKLGTVDFNEALKGNEFEFSINGVDFKFDRNTTIRDMMNTVNKSDAGVTMSFNALAQSFELKSSATGAGEEINVEQKKGNLLNSLFNVSGSTLGTAPTKSVTLSEKRVDNNATLSLNLTAEGLEKNDRITVNGKTLGITGISQTQNTEKITVDNKEVDALVYKQGGDTVYSYKDASGNKVYVKKDGDDYDDIMTVDRNGVVTVNSETKTESESDMLNQLGISKDMKQYTKAELESALNDAYLASFPGDKAEGLFSVADDFTVTFNADPGKAVSLSMNGSANVELKNYTESPVIASEKVISENPLTFILNGSEEVTISGQDGGPVTLADLESSGYFSYDEDTGELSVNGTNKLEFVNGANDISKIFGTSDLYGKENNGVMRERGTNAQVTINGVTLESRSNVFAVEGTTFGIDNIGEFDETDIKNGDAEEITVTVAKDTSKIKETILNFVEEYNKLLDSLHETLTTSRPKSDKSFYDPLTDEQKDEMKDEEIEKWEEKAKTGLLYHDSTITKVFNDIRNAVGTAHFGGMTLQALGIDTSDNYEEYGKLVIKDEGELDAAIEKYADEIADFFTDINDGLASRLNNAINSAIDTSTSRGYAKGSLAALAGVKNTRSESKNLLYTQMTNLQTLIDKLNERYEKEQERLWKRFSTLETYISDMNNQSMSLFGTALSGAQQQQQ